jgi:hypothetical protein
MFCPQGPHLVEDDFGMMMVAALLNHSLNAGVNETTVQFNTIRKTRSVLSNHKRTAVEEIMHAALAGYNKDDDEIHQHLYVHLMV